MIGTTQLMIDIADVIRGLPAESRASAASFESAAWQHWVKALQ